MSKALKLMRELAVWLPERRVFQAEGTASMLEWSETVKAADGKTENRELNHLGPWLLL